mgnify:CR=1 FL=1
MINGQKNDKRIRVIHKENGGLSDASKFWNRYSPGEIYNIYR